MPPELSDVGFLHLGRPESGVRRYAQLIAAAARERPGLTVREADAGRVDEGKGRLTEATAELAGAQVLFLQWNRRGWGQHGGSLLRSMRFRRAYRGALVVTLHDIFERRSVRQRWLRADAWSLRWLGRVADRIVVHSDVEVERLRGIIPAERLAVIPHFVDRRAPGLTPAEARARLGLGDRRIVTLAGFVYGRKGHRFAVDAVPELPPDVMMVYAGGPVAGRNFVYDLALTRAQELQLGDRFRITGYLSDEDLATWIAATHLAIAPFTDLSASGSLSLWIAAGKPMLVSDLPSLREYERWRPGALRYFGPPQAGPLAAAINEQLAGELPDPDPATLELGEALSLERTLDRYLAVAKDALAAHSR